MVHDFCCRSLALDVLVGKSRGLRAYLRTCDHKTDPTHDRFLLVLHGWKRPTRLNRHRGASDDWRLAHAVLVKAQRRQVPVWAMMLAGCCRCSSCRSTMFWSWFFTYVCLRGEARAWRDHAFCRARQKKRKTGGTGKKAKPDMVCGITEP